MQLTKYIFVGILLIILAICLDYYWNVLILYKNLGYSDIKTLGV